VNIERLVRLCAVLERRAGARARAATGCAQLCVRQQHAESRALLRQRADLGAQSTWSRAACTLIEARSALARRRLDRLACERREREREAAVHVQTMRRWMQTRRGLELRAARMAAARRDDER
jgi:hypothetical protein